MHLSFLVILEVFFAFLIAYFSVPVLIRKVKQRGFLAPDIYKPKHPKIPELGGLAIFIGYILPLLFVLPFIPYLDQYHLLAVIATVILVELIGIIDDIFAIRQSVKVILPLFAAIPLMVTEAGTSSMFFPLIGTVNFGIFYALILIPIGITAAANLTNMLAGFNGLEAGNGFIAVLTVAVAALLLGHMETVVILAPLLGALLAFLKYNWYPAKIFPGDCGTLLIGTVIASAVIVGNMELVGVLSLSLYIFNFLLFIFIVNKYSPKYKFGKVDSKGYIHPPAKEYFYSLYFLIAKYKKVKEKDIVKIILKLQLLVSLAVVLWVCSLVW